MRKLVILDCRELKDRTSSHEYLMDIMEFPEYYGKNLDALNDCLFEMRECDVILRAAKEVPLTGYTAKILDVFEDAAKENCRLKIYRES